VPGNAVALAGTGGVELGFTSPWGFQWLWGEVLPGRKRCQSIGRIILSMKLTGKPGTGECAVEDSRLAGERPVLEIPHSSR